MSSYIQKREFSSIIYPTFLLKFSDRSPPSPNKLERETLLLHNNSAKISAQNRPLSIRNGSRLQVATSTLLNRINSNPASVGRWGPKRMDDAGGEIRVQGDHRWVSGRRRRRVRSRFGVQQAHPSHEALHQLRCATEEQRPLLAARRIVLQLPPRRTGQSLPSRLQRHHSLPELKTTSPVMLIINYVKLCIFYI